MRYLVTGGVGFLGTNLCLKLLESHEVVAMDNLSTGRQSNVDLLSEKSNFKFILHDIVNPLPDLGEFDMIFNLACPASPPQYQKDRVQTFRTSVWGAWNVLNYGAPVIHTSTSEVYGDPGVSPQPESYCGNVNPVGPRSCYDEGKRAAETLINDSGRNAKIIRIFNTYGPHMAMDDGRVVTNFISSALSGKPLTVYGDGKQTRSFCYVDDLIEGIVALSETEFSGPVNLGNDNEITIMELAETLEKVLGKKLEKEFLDLPGDDPKRRRPDISLAKKLINWKPETDLEAGLRKTIRELKI
jgi:UDP-glucuronate decarboxylase